MTTLVCSLQYSDIHICVIWLKYSEHFVHIIFNWLFSRIEFYCGFYCLHWETSFYNTGQTHCTARVYTHTCTTIWGYENQYCLKTNGEPVLNK